MSEKKFVTYSEAARIVDRHPQTVRRWVRERHLFTFHGRVSRAQLLEVDRKMRAARRTGTAASL